MATVKIKKIGNLFNSKQGGAYMTLTGLPRIYAPDVMGIRMDISLLNEEENETQYGTCHPPHGWLDFSIEWGGLCPTIDASIQFWHTLIVEKHKWKSSQE